MTMRSGARMWCCGLLLSFLAGGVAQETVWRESRAQVNELYRQGRAADGLPVARRALAAAETAFGPEHLEVASALRDLAVLHHSLRQFSEAESFYRRALHMQEKAAGPQSQELAPTLDFLARMYMDQKKDPEAEPLLLRCLSIDEKTLGNGHVEVAHILTALGELYFRSGADVGGRQAFERALVIRENEG